MCTQAAPPCTHAPPHSCTQVCLETGLRQFGVLPNCTHCFCLDCIRAWRATHSAKLQVSRSCPECRAPSHFVVPSAVFITQPRPRVESAVLAVPHLATTAAWPHRASGLGCALSHSGGAPPPPTPQWQRVVLTSACAKAAHLAPSPPPVTPSRPGRKAALIDGYQQKLRGVACKHFAFGAGTCPFGSSCFYAHTDKLGRPVASDPRYALGASGSSTHVQTYRLSDYLFGCGDDPHDLLSSIPLVEDEHREGDSSRGV